MEQLKLVFVFVTVTLHFTYGIHSFIEPTDEQCDPCLNQIAESIAKLINQRFDELEQRLALRSQDTISELLRAVDGRIQNLQIILNERPYSQKPNSCNCIGDTERIQASTEPARSNYRYVDEITEPDDASTIIYPVEVATSNIDNVSDYESSSVSPDTTIRTTTINWNNPGGDTDPLTTPGELQPSKKKFVVPWVETSSARPAESTPATSSTLSTTNLVIVNALTTVSVTEDEEPTTPRVSPQTSAAPTARNPGRKPTEVSSFNNSTNPSTTRPKGPILLAIWYARTYIGGNWRLIHSRFDGSLDFNRSWSEFREPFGTLPGEYWMGLEAMHQLTQSGEYELLVFLKGFDGTVKTALYDGFHVGSESTRYRLVVGPFVKGDARDSLSGISGQMFSTYDRDNDRALCASCAEIYKSGWWFKDCTDANLNGPYGLFEAEMASMSWWGFNRDYQGLKEAAMMIRKKKFSVN